MTFIEKMIAKQCITDLLRAGYAISVQDGEDIVLERSKSPRTILAAMATTDEDRFFVYKEGLTPPSFVYFVYGNDGWDVINDYSVSLETVISKTNALADKLSA